MRGPHGRGEFRGEFDERGQLVAGPESAADGVEKADQRAAEKIAAIAPRPQPELVVPRGAFESLAQALREDI